MILAKQYVNLYGVMESGEWSNNVIISATQ